MNKNEDMRVVIDNPEAQRLVTSPRYTAGDEVAGPNDANPTLVNQEEERRAGIMNEKILYQTPQEVSTKTNAFYLMYLIIQWISDLVCRMVGGILIVVAYYNLPLSFEVLAWFLAGYHAFKVLFNTFFYVLYGKRLEDLKKSYVFDAMLSIGHIIVYVGLAEYFRGNLEVDKLKYAMIPNIVLTFLRMVVGESMDTPYLPGATTSFLESIQIICIAIRLEHFDSEISWGWTLFYYYAMAVIGVIACAIVFVSLVVIVSATAVRRVPLGGFAYFLILSVGVSVILYLLPMILLVHSFRGLLEAGYISPPNPGFSAPDALLFRTGWLLLASCAVCLILFFVLYCMGRELFLNYFKGNKAKTISLKSFTKDIQLNANQMSGNYFKAGAAGGEQKPGEPGDAETCLICVERNAELLTDPCGHNCFCEACATEYLKQKEECPLCKQKIEKLYLIFKDPETKRYMAKGVIMLKR